MKKRILVASLMVMIATPVFGDSAVFTTRKDTDKFLLQCLNEAERATAEVAGRKDPAQVGFTVFYTSHQVFRCDETAPVACAQRCEPKAASVEE